MPRTSFGPLTSRRQAGAALVVGLLLLLVLTVLAISGVNSTSLNLIMAGNTQFTQTAFQAAESGIEYSLAANDFNPDPSLDPETKTDADTEDEDDCFEAVSTVQVCGIPQPALPGSSQGAYSTFHFEIDSKGCAKRAASAENIQALALIAPKDATFAPVENCPSTGGTLTKME
jgi:type IV pilus assembly protein PilX